ncbi:uncharacterized protein LOC111704550 isoform X2 [Eurytemora carolleeae]|nr:uncharacterized protein LOC111704550 isoform X2 [Eurytemora carolleeae]XP_023332592.1 uncharacterized protein LOC111704550 isoform X2 [Eurytemora carolleeae]|eukprot:XP_023332591.1 uncharacterized protein LOC111704550 isoform X2 [Eurytemora affinis]
MFDAVVWLFIFTLLLLLLLAFFKLLIEFPGFMNWKCIYIEPHPDKIEIDLSEYELAAIEIPDKKVTEVKEVKAVMLDVEKQKCEVPSHMEEVSSGTSDYVSEVMSSTEDPDKVLKAKLQFQDKIIVINEHVGRQC